jgi:hypothetical protein
MVKETAAHLINRTASHFRGSRNNRRELQHRHLRRNNVRRIVLCKGRGKGEEEEDEDAKEELEVGRVIYSSHLSVILY